MKNDQKSSSRWLLQVPLLMGVCFLNAHAGLPLKDNVDVDKQLSQADPFGFGKFLKSKHNGAQGSGLSPISLALDLDSLCAKNAYYDDVMAALEGEINALKGISSPLDFQKKVDNVKKAINCLKNKQKSFGEKLDLLAKRLSTTHYDAAHVHASPRDDLKSTQSFSLAFKSIANEIEQSPPIKNIQGKAQNSVEYYKRAIQILSRVSSNERVEAIQFLLKEAHDSGLDGPIYKNKEAVVKMLQDELNRQ
jgi:hypothetical protein